MVIISSCISFHGAKIRISGQITKFIGVIEAICALFYLDRLIFSKILSKFAADFKTKHISTKNETEYEEYKPIHIHGGKKEVVR
jgi:hypothetical protein